MWKIKPSNWYLGIGTINIEEMVLENYGQEYEEVEVDVGGVEDAEELLEEFDEELIEHEEVEESEYEDQVIDSPDKIKSNKEAAKGKSRSKEKKTDGDVSSEEEAWLNALESGKLEEVQHDILTFLTIQPVMLKIFFFYERLMKNWKKSATQN